MIFSSPTFLFLFFPVVLAAMTMTKKNYRNHVLFSSSLIFYLWGEGKFVYLLLSSILITFLFGHLLENSRSRHRKFFLVAGVALNLLPLFIFKYMNFALKAVEPIFTLFNHPPIHLHHIHLPAGISFFTFQAISYLVDIYRQTVPAERRLLNCGLYIAMFPQLIAGPIIRYHDIAQQLRQRTVTLQSFAYGAERFVFGLAKKVLLADFLGIKADQLFSIPVHEITAGEAWLGAICFSLQIYYDFSGYSDMAIGLGSMFGFRFPENFRYPYISTSIREFWRRWHISLSTWLRDYLYIPLGGNRLGTARTMVNLLLVFLLCGLWHGANWTFIVWGLWHGFFLVLERIIPFRQQNIFQKVSAWTYVFFVVLIGWVLFRSPDMATAWEYIMAMFGNNASTPNLFWTSFIDDKRLLAELLLGLAIATPLYDTVLYHAGKITQNTRPLVPVKVLAVSAVSAYRLVLFATLFYFVLISTAAQSFHPFLYFQF